MEVINNLDIDGKLKIVQNTNMNSFTIDSILLSNFVKLKKKDNLIVDLCAGNGPVGMYLTLKKKQIKIKLVEIQEENCILAEKSLKLNNLENQIDIINANLIDVSLSIGKNIYDIVVCNPPYFRVDKDSNLNTNKKYSIARHELTVNLEQIIIESKKLLTNVGFLYFVHRPERIDEIIIMLNKYDFEIKTLQFVHPFLGQEANTILVEAKKGKSLNNKVRILKPLFVYDDNHEYTEDMKKAMQMTEI